MDKRAAGASPRSSAGAVASSRRESSEPGAVASSRRESSLPCKRGSSLPCSPCGIVATQSSGHGTRLPAVASQANPVRWLPAVASQASRASGVFTPVFTMRDRGHSKQWPRHPANPGRWLPAAVNQASRARGASSLPCSPCGIVATQSSGHDTQRLRGILRNQNQPERSDVVVERYRGLSAAHDHCPRDGHNE